MSPKHCKLNYEKEVKVLAVQSCPTLCNPMDCSPPGSSVHGILQVRILQWIAVPLSGGAFLTQGSNLGFLHYNKVSSLQSEPLYKLHSSPSPNLFLLYSLVWLYPPVTQARNMAPSPPSSPIAHPISKHHYFLSLGCYFTNVFSVPQTSHILMTLDEVYPPTKL